MYEVRSVLKKFIDALDDISFSQHNLVPHGHKFILHLRFKTMDELNTLTEEILEEFLLDVPSVSKYLSIEHLCKNSPYSTVPVIYVRPCETEGYHFTGIITKQRLLESVAPAHRALATLGKTGKDLVKIPSYIVTYRNHRTVNERYTCTFAEGIELHEQHHLEEHTGHEFYKTIIGDGSREFMPEPATDTVLIILLEITICTEVIAHKDSHDFTFRKPSLTISTTFTIAIIGW